MRTNGRVVRGRTGQEMHVLGGDAHELGERAVVQMPGQSRAAVATRAPPLQHDVRCQGVVACADRRVTPDEISRPQPGRVGSHLDQAADSAESRYDGWFEG